MTDILHITDRERTQAAVIRALESARDEMAKRIPQWLPIESAPKDGTRIHVWRRHGTYPRQVKYDAQYDAFQDDDGIHVHGLTHWMPLPPPPPADKPIWDQLAEIGASDPQAWEKT